MGFFLPTVNVNKFKFDFKLERDECTGTRICIFVVTCIFWSDCPNDFKIVQFIFQNITHVFPTVMTTFEYKQLLKRYCFYNNTIQ